MASISRTFLMAEPAEEAQQRFKGELMPGLDELGFTLRDDASGHLVYGPRGAGGRVAAASVLAPVVGVLAAGSAAWRSTKGHRLEVDFTATESGCKVEIYGVAGSRTVERINLLGRNGHWPATLNDPDWPAPFEVSDELIEWEGENIDPKSLDRITRRALKRAGRL